MNDKKVLTCSELCRLCITRAGDGDLFDIPDLVQDIYLCTGVKVNKSNNLPRKICSKCLKIVCNAKKLRLLVSENETNMKILFDHDGTVNFDIGEDSKENDCSSINSDITFEDPSDDEHLCNISKKRQSILAKHDKLEKDCTYIEGTKYGISKSFTFNGQDKVDVMYTCSICPKTFTTWKRVYCHRRVHNKKIGCSNCSKKFATKADLEKHMRTHTGERPFTCDICDKSFTQSSTLRAHRATMHDHDLKSPMKYDSDCSS